MPWAFSPGLLVNLTNPKANICIGALVLQFIDLGRSQVEQYLLVAATVSMTDIVVISAYALAARRLGRWLHDPQAIRLQNKAFGGLFLSAGALLGFFLALAMSLRCQRDGPRCVNVERLRKLHFTRP